MYPYITPYGTQTSFARYPAVGQPSTGILSKQKFRTTVDTDLAGLSSCIDPNTHIGDSLGTANKMETGFIQVLSRG